MNLRPLLLIVGSGAVALASCGDDQISGPTEGTILVAALTTGDDLDQNGYTISVNSSQANPIGLQDTLFFTALEEGDYEVLLAGVAENCAPAEGTNPQTATVVGGDTVSVIFDIACEAVPPDGGGGGDLLRTHR